MMQMWFLLFGTENIVVLKSVVCVAKVITYLSMHDVYVSTLIKIIHLLRFIPIDDTF